MSVVMLDLLPPSAAVAVGGTLEQSEAPIAADAVVMVDDVEVLGAYNRCNCAASDDNPY
ncbi:hypothetical protein [Lentzea aerocolonigenes]|uniref:hypothetical protein n=1 Tax=Lentzea aerocolonigenes TaxID=68170 RepID=UPI000A996DA6|nr:hypothetical protein [Lentzea aerocolonigenes]MCP2244641.1 hypothetical protein [Lentzea aerocolonigenes]